MNLQEKLYLQVQAAKRLVEKWRSEAADTGSDPDDELYRNGLRQCAKELEEALTK